MKKSYFALLSLLITALFSCEEDTTLVVDFNQSYRTISDDSFEALVVPLVLNSAQLGASGIYYGTDSVLTNLNSTKIESSVSGDEAYSIIVDSLNLSETYYWQPYIEVNWGEFRGDVLSFVTTPAPPCIGIGCPGPAGGYIIYEDGFGGGIEAAPSAISEMWGCSGFIQNAPDTLVGTGQANTTAILSGCITPSAAHVCNIFSFGGFTDWYLPSRDELILIYQNLYQASLGSYPAATFWSSSEISTLYAHGYNFGTGFPVTGFKPDVNYIIPVRTF